MVHRAFYNSKHLLICLKGKFSARNWSLFLVTLKTTFGLSFYCKILFNIVCVNIFKVIMSAENLTF